MFILAMLDSRMGDRSSATESPGSMESAGNE